MAAMEVYKPEPPEDCPYKDEEPWKCLLAQYRLPSMTTPMFHAQYLYDIGQLGIASFPDVQAATDDEWGWARSAVARPFREMFHEMLKPPNGIFAVSCYQHGFLTLDSWRDVKVRSDGEPIDVSEALYRWLQGEEVQLIDEDYEHVFCQDTEDAMDEHCNHTCKPCTYPPDPT